MNTVLVLSIILFLFCEACYALTPAVELKSFSVNITNNEDFFDIDATGVFEIRSDKYIIVVLLLANIVLSIHVLFFIENVEEVVVDDFDEKLISLN